MEDLLVFNGGAVKALGNGKVAGYLVEFADPVSLTGTPDLDNEYFTKNTDFDIDQGQKASVYYDHGQDETLKKRKLGRGPMQVKDAGVWFEAQLNLADDYERYVYKLTEMGKLGWSSGSTAHLVERKSVGAFKEITKWPLGADASLTFRPASHTNRAVALKSLTHTDLAEVIKSLEVRKDEEEKEFSIAGLPALSRVVAPSDLKGLAERSESTEAAVEEFLTHGQIVSEVLKSHLARVENNAEFRFVKDGRQMSTVNRQRIETMRTKLSRMITEHKSIDAGLERLQRMSEAVKAQADGMNEAARFELWNFYRISGTTPKEFNDGSQHMGEARLQRTG